MLPQLEGPRRGTADSAYAEAGAVQIARPFTAAHEMMSEGEEDEERAESPDNDYENEFKEVLYFSFIDLL